MHLQLALQNQPCKHINFSSLIAIKNYITVNLYSVLSKYLMTPINPHQWQFLYGLT